MFIWFHSYWAKSDDAKGIPTLYLKDGMGYYEMKGYVGPNFSQFSTTVSYRENNPVNFKCKVDPSSNIPHLICGGQVNGSDGRLELKVGDDALKTRRKSIDHYEVELPECMKGKSNYIVQLTAGWSDNPITLDGKNTTDNCFYVKTWQSPGKLEDSAFTFMVYMAKLKNNYICKNNKYNNL